ncbi:MAG: tetratricopeptide repeat protein [Bacteroidales bacterium]|nr:tetratricopeptide repeat protein [Bacteroidales bacterium]
MSKFKVIALFANLLFVGSMVCSAKDIKPVGDAVAIVKAEELISQKKYLSAYKMLDKYDPKNEKSVIFLKKVDIVQNYFLFNIMNQIFCLDDIPLDKTVEELRGNEEASECSSVMFAIDTIAQRLLEKEPNNCLLYKCLGEYYNSAADRFGDNWLDSKSASQLDLRIRARKNLLKAEEFGCNDDKLFSDIALTYMYEELFSDARGYLKKAIACSRDTVADYYYNLAVAHYFDQNNGDIQQAIHNAAIAARHYTRPDMLSDAYFMLGSCYLRTNDYQQALQNFKQAEKLHPGQYYNLTNMMVCNLKLGSDEYKSNIHSILEIYGYQTNAIAEMVQNFYVTDSTKGDALAEILKIEIEKGENPLYKANLQLSLGTLLLNQEKKKDAREPLLAAKKFFETDEEYEEIVGYINEMLKHAK